MNPDTWICQSLVHSCFFFFLQICCLNGIEKLMLLLNNDSEEVQRAAAGALRNAVYENDENKLKVKENNGLSFIPTVLNGSHDKETRRQLTG